MAMSGSGGMLSSRHWASILDRSSRERRNAFFTTSSIWLLLSSSERPISVRAATKSAVMIASEMLDASGRTLSASGISSTPAGTDSVTMRAEAVSHPRSDGESLRLYVRRLPILSAEDIAM
ncbi:hypothetical protein BF93_17485 [Brachybacterium phenoliresistens]|uniref:Uncharacterized protein n=1 Tax=Brachybacterium phenoliresistens TaxID=396014 RepID=Z9JSN0_9MICO|nr:hypothetical protein BF93_17485 [Brachybacterium phenoliresistens]